MKKSSKNIDSSYITYIDGLRAIAVLAVVIYHLNSTWLIGGFTGVDIFFTISGFVVSLSIAKKPGLSPTNFIASFYARRILRIVPALLVCLILVSLVEVLFIPISWLSDGIETTVPYAFWGLSNLVLMNSSNSYFGPKAEFNPFTHTWSLGIEEQFYLIFPLVFYWWTIADKDQRLRYISVSIFTTFSAFSLTYAWWLSQTNTETAFYATFTRFWELAAGVILYQITVDKYNNSSIDLGFKGLLGAYISLGLVILGFIFAPSDHFPFPWAFLPVIGTIGLLFFLPHSKNNLILTVLRNPLVVFIGKISYSLYLWHWPIFVLFRWTVGLDSIPSYTTAVFLAFSLAIASYYFVELPIRYSRQIRNLPKIKIIIFGITIVAFTCYITTTQILSQKIQLSLSVTSKEYSLWYVGNNEILHENPNSCPIETSIKPIEGEKITSLSRPNCQKPKIFKQIFVAGDSHAGVYSTMLRRLTMETGFNISIYDKPGCSYISLSASLAELSSDCQSFYRFTTTDILDHAQPGDIVFFPSLRLQRFTAQWKSFPETVVKEEMFGKAALSHRARATAEAITLLKPFTQRGIKVIFEAPTPIFKAPNFRCSDWFNRMNPICQGGLEIQKDILLNYRRPVMESMKTLSKEVSGVIIWDPFPILCPGNFCQATVDHKPLFFDADHISNYGSMLLYPSFKALLVELI